MTKIPISMTLDEWGHILGLMFVGLHMDEKDFPEGTIDAAVKFAQRMGFLVEYTKPRPELFS